MNIIKFVLGCMITLIAIVAFFPLLMALIFTAVILMLSSFIWIPIIFLFDKE